MAASKPVIGSVPCGSPAVVDVLVALAVAAVVLVELLLVAGVAVGAGDELPDDGDGDGDGLVFAGGGVVFVVVGVWVVVVWPASGSVYWLSPADGPPASAAGGTMPIAAASRTPGSQVLVTRRNRTPRVSHQRLSTGSGSACTETRKRLFCRISCSTRISRRVRDGSC